MDSRDLMADEEKKTSAGRWNQYSLENLTGLTERVSKLRDQSKYAVLRVLQLDANELDTYLISILKDQLKQISSIFSQTFFNRFEPELTLLLELVMFRLSVYASNATYGLRLMGLKYRDERKHSLDLAPYEDAPITKNQKILWGLFQIVFPWAWSRLQLISISNRWSDSEENTWKHRTWKLLESLEKVYHFLSLLNLLIFLYNGKYRTLIDRILRMRLVYSIKKMNRQVDFEFFSRQLVWHAFTEFIMFLMPLVSFQSIKGNLLRLLPMKNEQEALPLHICSICTSTKIHVPYQTNCGHIYCYYCIKSNMMTDPNYSCPRCGEVVKEIERIG